ncbi:type IV secretion protein IcmB [Candidatus Berkiella aquae]|uniref:AAA-like domain protein n=1 Tax=Candidatus Berkiella aquae TaxID=295108 RepID=A0A0Q9YUQ5_9GAMM|nr:type IV secretion protein IcmB [Candidatus Berkiella aquae]MCS5711123.1 type IV secretion protein IcmB [Candidatus Berkiella aquae]
MRTFVDSLLDNIDAFLGWLGSSLGQTADHFCTIETADSRHTLVARDGSLVSIIRVHGATELVGPQEFDKIHKGLINTLSPALSRPGHAVQMYFHYDKDLVKDEIRDIFRPAMATCDRLKMNLQDLFEERINHLSKFCATENCFLVLWTRPNSLSKTQLEQSNKAKLERSKDIKIPPIKHAQNILSAVPELRETHDSFVRSAINDMRDVNLYAVLLDVHQAVFEMRKSVDPEYTDREWRPVLPGDRIPMRNLKDPTGRDISEVMWPPLVPQIIPRDGEVINLRSCRIGDKIYSTHYIDLFPQEIKPFFELFKKAIHSRFPWRISFLIESDGIRTLGVKPVLASILSFASSQNPLICDAAELLKFLDSSTDYAIVKFRVTASTWAGVGEERLLRTRSAELAKAMQSWGHCEVGEISGDSYEAALTTALGISTNSIATASAAPLNDVCYMLPFTRPASPWVTGATLFRSPDGKPWPYQPGSTQQTTWIDLVYARPGSGKSVLSNSINLALCLQGGIARLPRIAIVDIGPSSSGLISLIKESLPKEQRHLAAYHRLRMTPQYSINPFDTQLGCRYPTPLERSFLVNFITLLATPIGEAKAYDGISDMAGMIVDELFKALSDTQNPNKYTRDLEPGVDKILDEINFQTDAHTSWWEVVDALFKSDKVHEAVLAQRYCSPLIADAVSICRTKVVEDLYGKIVAPTGEPLITAFGRMLSAAVREYPILSRITQFDLGESRVISLDLDEVAKTGGEAADRQTAVMYMLARYIMAKSFYLTEDNLEDFPKQYHDYHRQRILQIREDPKRLVMDEFHRTSKAQAVRDQVVVDMREGRKWKVQVALLSQSLDDFDSVMVEFATAIFIMDAGPQQAIDKSVKTFGLSETAKIALATRVHGPRAEGATFLAQFATKLGMNTQLCTSTLGPIELWAFNTTAEDARIRNALYKKIGANETRKLLAMLYPGGSAAKVVEERLAKRKEGGEKIDDGVSNSVIDELIDEILKIYEGTTSGAAQISLQV